MSVCVIIPAWNAERTIARSIASALTQNEVSEVVVIDDASTDATRSVAAAADDGTGRLVVLHQSVNSGPSASRNLALASSRVPYVAILDADDYFLPNRFAPLLAIQGWDAIADNIAFVPEHRLDLQSAIASDEGETVARPLSLRALLEGGVYRRGSRRAELGFLKPVIRRAFLDRHVLGYDETLRLSEDFVLYARMLSAGANFLVTERCGYVAVVRPTSLSRCHATADLEALLVAIDRWGRGAHLDAAERRLFNRYRARLSANYRHRRLLDDNRSVGLTKALTRALDEPLRVPSVLARVIRDKLATASGQSNDQASLRYLLAG